MRNGPPYPDYLAGTAAGLDITFERTFFRPREADLEDHPALGPVVVCNDLERYELNDSIAEVLLNLDHNSPEAHLAFVREYGPLSPDLRYKRELGAGLYIDKKMLVEDVNLSMKTLRLLLHDVKATHGNLVPTEFARVVLEPNLSLPVVEPLTAFTVRAGHVKAAKVTWDAWTADRFSPMALAQAWPEGIEHTYEELGYLVEMPQTRKEAESLIDATSFAIADGMLSVGGTGSVRLSISLDALAFAEVGAAYREGRPYKRCRNERCRRWFSLQDTTTKSGQHRPSRAEYHTYKCQQAQKSRERRRKEREGST